MDKKTELLQRLNDIGEALESQEGALLLLGVGSSGMETDRMDDYSDLDFFVYVRNGAKQRFIDRLDWLEKVHPLAYAFRNTEDGYKILFEDGIYGEFAVFEEREARDVSYRGGRVVWKRQACLLEVPENGNAVLQSIRKESLDFPINEAVTNLYVGLCRYARGEMLSAVRFIQGYAVDSLLSVLHLVERETDYYPDAYGNERRLEKRFPEFAKALPGMVGGYGQVPESALAVLAYLERIYPVNTRMSEEVRKLAGSLLGSGD